MSVLTQIRNWFNLGTEETEDVGLDALTDELSQREEVLNLSAVYQDGQINRTGETTAVFPILVYNDDEYYTTTSKEFPLPRDGLDETDSNLTAFLASSCGIPREEVGVEHIRQIGGRNADARLNFMGNIRVYDPVPEENGAEVDFDQGVDDNDGENIAEAPDEDPRDEDEDTDDTLNQEVAESVTLCGREVIQYSAQNIEDVENETYPTPDEVAERENLADVNGVGPQRAEWLRDCWGVYGDSDSYGKGYRLFDWRVAESVTLCGREVIQYSAQNIEDVESLGDIGVYDPVSEENGAEVDFDKGVDDYDGKN